MKIRIRYILLATCLLAVSISAAKHHQEPEITVELPERNPAIQVTLKEMTIADRVKADRLEAKLEAETEESTEQITEEPNIYTEEELETLAIIIYQEGGSDRVHDECRQMIGEVFLNRVADDRYPNTFYEVATQKQQYGRLYWTGLEWPERANNPGEAHAVQRAYDTAEALLMGSVERLLPEDTVYQAEFEQGRETVAHCCGHYFCR